MQWEIIYLGNRPVGYTRRSIEIATPNQVEPFGDFKDAKSVTLLCLEAESRIRISRKSSDPIDQTVFLRTLEKLDGELLGIEGNIDTGVVKRKFTGNVRDGALNIQITEDRVVSSNSVPWDPSYRGPFAIEQSLRKSPMEPKEIRVVRYLDPFQMAVTESSLEGLSVGQTVDFEGQFADRLEIENRSTTQGRTSNSLLWTDRNGIVRKSYTAGLDRLSFDCDPVTARYVISKEEFDASSFKDLPLLGSFATLPDAQQGGFRIASELLRHDGSISSKTNQIVERVNEKTWDVQVRSVSEDGGQDTADLPGQDALASTGVIDWKEPTIQRWLSSQIATSDSSANTGSNTQSQRRVLAAKTRAWISKNVGRTELDRTLQTATSTLRNRKGDAMDQAILLTGALRGLSIPARVAIGFRAEPSSIRPTYRLHLWAEYHDSIRWIPIDSFLETDTVPIDRIKITESTMPSLNAYEPILTAIRLTTDMELTARTRKP
ncbi:MAG: transglutaminase-like domain-containing protein [Pirellula sp.]|nr:transglutaminase-like domain-containing protein [Pirellula sp.]